jgi:hypothetical protein
MYYDWPLTPLRLLNGERGLVKRDIVNFFGRDTRK